MRTVPSLIAPHAPPVARQPLDGDQAGTCYICALPTERGQRRPPSDVFTAWANCAVGDVLCPACARALAWRDVRMFSWLATPAGVRFEGRGDRGWLWDALLAPPPPPYAAYVTRGGQKQGWISGARQVATSQRTTPVLTDWTDRPVLLRDADRARFAPVIAALRARKVTRAALLAGAFPPATWARAAADGYEEALRAATMYAGDPRWEVLVSVSNAPDAAGTPAGGRRDDPVACPRLPLGGLADAGRE